MEANARKVADAERSVSANGRSSPVEDVLVSVRDVRFEYEGTADPVVDQLSLDVRAGRNVGIVGPSGCGKSTLLAVLAGLLEPTRGSVTWSPAPDGRHHLSMLFQKDTLLPWRTVAQNIEVSNEFRAARRRRKNSPGRPDVAELLQLAGLGGAAELYPYQLSGGMRRRAAFLTSVAPMPQVLLLDEPFSSLDEPTRVGIHQDVFHIGHQYGMTLILVTHDLAEALSLCDEIIILSNKPGRVVSSHEVPFGQQREMLHIRQDPSFLRLYGTLWEELSDQIGASTHDTNPEDYG